MADPVTSLSDIRKVNAVQRSSTLKALKPEVQNVSAEDTLSPTRTLEAIESLSTSLAQSEPVDQERINEIRSRIESGNYRVDSESVARKFLELEQLLKK